MNQYMKIAKDLAEDNLKINAGGPFGACIVKDGEIIGKGSNQVLASKDPTAHAEIMAIREACKNLDTYDLNGAELYTTCYPCPMCLSAIIWARINKVYYGNTSNDAEIIGFKDEDIYDFIKGIKTDLLTLECIDREETIKTFEEYDKKDSNEIY